MKKLFYIALLLFSVTTVKSQIAISIGVGTSLLTINGEPSSAASAVCFGFGMEFQDSTSSIIPMLNFDRNSWSIPGAAANMNLISGGLRIKTSNTPTNFYFSGSFGVDSKGEFIFLLPGIGMDFRLSRKSSLFLDAKYALVVSGNVLEFISLRAGIRVRL